MLRRSSRARLYTFFARLGPMYRYGASGALLVLFLIIWRSTILVALEYQLTHYRSEVDSLKKHCDLLEEITANNARLSRAIQNLKTSCKSCSVAQRHSLGNSIDFVFNQAAQSGIMIGMCLPQEEKDHEWCTEQTFFFDFDGTFEAITNFFNAIAQQKRMIRCSRVHITKLSDGLLKVGCILNFYSMKPSTEGV
ncbi:MAG: type 4a pilus biogenesis protein PilO [Candidatus Babeliales bacterium]